MEDAERKTIMVVDDEPDIAFTIRLVLEMDGYAVLVARTGEEALEMLEREEPDVLLLDIRLPGIDGWEVLDRLRSSDRLHRLPVIMISAHAGPSAADVALAQGCSAYLPKPFEPDELLDKVADAIRSLSAAGD